MVMKRIWQAKGISLFFIFLPIISDRNTIISFKSKKIFIKEIALKFYSLSSGLIELDLGS